MRLVEKVNVKFGADDVRTVKFVQTSPRRVRVTCKGKPAIVIRCYADNRVAAFSRIANSKGEVKRIEVPGATMKAAYSKSVRQLWN